MKNYDIKIAETGLSLGQKIVFKSRKIAYLVPNMFSRLYKGFLKMVKALGAKIADSTADVRSSISEAVSDAAKEAVEAREEYNVNKIAKINEKVEKKEEAVAAVKQNENISDRDKNYIIKGYESDIERLRNKTIKVANAPRRLLISLVFIQKLFTNRKKRKAKAAQAFFDRIPSVNAGTNEIQVPENNLDMSTQNVDDPVATPTPVEVDLSKNEDMDIAIGKYIEINSRKIELEERIRKDQEELDMYKAELEKLVEQYGFTREDVEQRIIRK